MAEKRDEKRPNKGKEEGVRSSRTAVVKQAVHLTECGLGRSADHREPPVGAGHDGTGASSWVLTGASAPYGCGLVYLVSPFNPHSHSLTLVVPPRPLGYWTRTFSRLLPSSRRLETDLDWLVPDFTDMNRLESAFDGSHAFFMV